MGRRTRRALLALAIVLALAAGGAAGSAGDGTGYLVGPPRAPSGAVDVSGQSEPAVAVDQARFVAITSGGRHACGLHSDGTLACWGHNGSGQAQAPGGRFSTVQAGEWFTCGLRLDGRVECWGHLGYKATGPPEGPFTALTVGRHHACGVRAEGTAACWGDRGAAQPRPVDSPFTAVEAGLRGGSSCGLRLDGTVSCWDHEFNRDPSQARTTARSLRVSQPRGRLRVRHAGRPDRDVLVQRRIRLSRGSGRSVPGGGVGLR